MEGRGTIGCAKDFKDWGCAGNCLACSTCSAVELDLAAQECLQSHPLLPQGPLHSTSNQPPTIKTCPTVLLELEALQVAKHVGIEGLCPAHDGLRVALHLGQGITLSGVRGHKNTV